jgi:hypothetical protein
MHPQSIVLSSLVLLLCLILSLQLDDWYSRRSTEKNAAASREKEQWRLAGALGEMKSTRGNSVAGLAGELQAGGDLRAMRASSSQQRPLPFELVDWLHRVSAATRMQQLPEYTLLLSLCLALSTPPLQRAESDGRRGFHLSALQDHTEGKKGSSASDIIYPSASKATPCVLPFLCRSPFFFLLSFDGGRLTDQ